MVEECGSRWGGCSVIFDQTSEIVVALDEYLPGHPPSPRRQTGEDEEGMAQKSKEFAAAGNRVYLPITD
jgi:hypothetical protein